ncbi:MAG: META domain-containing protein [Candidatus Krumholzibacteriia bacterium]
MRIGIGLMVTAAVLLAGCGGSNAGKDGTAGKAGTDPLAATSWNLTALPGAELPAAVAVTAQFHEGRLGGGAGCNRYSAAYEVRGDSLRIGRAGITKMMCPDPQMAVENAFLAALADVATFTLADGRLQLRTAAGGTLAFAAAPFETPQP